MHGIGGDTRVVFVVQASPAPTSPVSVYALDRATGEPLGPVPPPPTGWRTPVVIEIEQWEEDEGGTRGAFLLQDAGGPPSSAGAVRTVIHRYEYEYRPGTGLTARWLEAHSLPLGTPSDPAAVPSGLLWSAGMVRLPGGQVAVSDFIAGTIWVAGRSLEDWRLAMWDPDFLPGPAAPALVAGRAAGGGTREKWFAGLAGMYPGIHSLTYAAATDELCTLRSAPPGGLFCIDRATLVDTDRSPIGKPKRVLVPPQEGLSDATDGIAFDRFHPASEWIYWARALADVRFGAINVLRRVSLRTGEIQEVARSNVLYDFTGNVAPLPPVDGSPASVIASAVGQEENNPEANFLLLGMPDFVAPTPVPAVEIAP